MKFHQRCRLSFLALVLLFGMLAPVVASPSFDINPKGLGLEILQGDKQVVEIESFAFNFIEPDTLFLTSNGPDTTTVTLHFGQKDGHHMDFPETLVMSIIQNGNTLHFQAGHDAFNHITIRLKDRDEHYFGLIEKLYPHNAKSPDLRGNVVDVEVYAHGELDYAENYASAYSAFFMSSAGYASFFDTFAKGRYHLGINGVTEIYHQTGKLDWYLFTGENGQKIHQSYYQVIGAPKSVPIWACGPVFWRDDNGGGKDEILDDIQHFTDLKIPLTACFVDRPYSDGGHEWSHMNFNSKFANPEQWIKTIQDQYGMEFMTWVGPMTFSDMDFPGLLPNYRTYIDLTNPDALAEFESRMSRNQYAVGVKGHKMDRADENFPMTAKWYSPVNESETRNMYVYLYAKVMDQLLSHAHGKDQFNFARAAFHRSQPYLSAVWGGDVRNNWQGMSGNMANAIRCGFMGFPVWGSDTGGYLGEGRIDETLYARWMEWSAWAGMLDIKIDGAGGSGEDRPPWKYSKTLQHIFRTVCEQRMEMLPTLYTCTNSTASNGVLMQPLAYHNLSDTKTYDMWDEYIFANTFLVAPIFSTDNSRDIYLPEGIWIDYYDHTQQIEGPVTISRDVPLDRIPVFVRANSIYVTGNIHQGSSKVWDKKSEPAVTVHVFPGADGETAAFNYMDYLDQDQIKPIQLAVEGSKTTLKAEPLSTPATLALHCDTAPKSVTLNGKSVKGNYSKKTQKLRVKLEKATPAVLEVVR